MEEVPKTFSSLKNCFSMISHLLIRMAIETVLIVDLAGGQSSSIEKLNTIKAQKINQLPQRRNIFKEKFSKILR